MSAAPSFATDKLELEKRIHSRVWNTTSSIKRLFYPPVFKLVDDYLFYQGLLDSFSGSIPRTVHTLFKRLFSLQKDYCVYVSFLELYNENLIDLLGGIGVEPTLKVDHVHQLAQVKRLILTLYLLSRFTRTNSIGALKLR